MGDGLMGIRQDLEKQGYKVDWNPSGAIRITDPKTGKSADLLPGSYYVDKSGTAQWYCNTKQQVQKALTSNTGVTQSSYTSSANSGTPESTSTNNSNVTSNQYLQANGLYTTNNGLNNNNINTSATASTMAPENIGNTYPTYDSSIFSSYNSVIQSQQNQLNQLQQTVNQLVQALQNNAPYYSSPSAYLSALASYGGGTQSVGNTNVTVPAGTPTTANTTDTSASTTTPQSPSQLSTLGATMSLGVPLVSVVPTADDVYNLYKQYNNGQDNAQAQAFFASPDFQQVLQGNIPTWMLTDPGWAAFLQKLFQLYNPQADANTLALFNKLLTSVQ